jgi:hypothetical protein
MAYAGRRVFPNLQSVLAILVVAHGTRFGTVVACGSLPNPPTAVGDSVARRRLSSPCSLWRTASIAASDLSVDTQGAGARRLAYISSKPHASMVGALTKDARACGPGEVAR